MKPGARTKPRWINVIDKDSRTTFDVDIHLTPDDIPRAFRVYPDENSGRLVVEFKYADEEATITEPKSDFLWLRLGKHSGTVYGFEVALKQLHETDVVVNLIEAIQGSNKAGTPNMKVVKNILERECVQIGQLITATAPINR